MAITYDMTQQADNMSHPIHDMLYIPQTIQLNNRINGKKITAI